jgi:hypothetical protein
MSFSTLQEVQPGWKVFAGEQRVGTVTEVAPDALTLERGRLLHHHYRIPVECVAEAEAGIVDLNLDPDELEGYETTT